MQRSYRQLLILLGFLLAAGSALGQAVGDYQTRVAGNWTAPGTWQVCVTAGGGFVNLPSPAAGIYQNVIPGTGATQPTGAINLKNAVTINTAVSADEVSITAAAHLITSPGVFTIADGTGDDLTVSGGSISGTGTLSIAASATYNHSQNGGTIPLATWGANSLCMITGVSGNIAITAGNVFQNFKYDCAQGAGINRSFSGTLGGTTSIAGNFTIVKTGGGQLRLTGPAPFALSVGGNLDLQAGTLNMSSGAGVATINLKGDLLLAASTLLTESGAGDNSTIVFDKSPAAVQNITASGTITQFVNFQINNTAGVSLNADASLPGSLGTLTQTAGDINMNGKQLTIVGNFSQASGSLNPLFPTTASLVISGAGTFPATVQIYTSSLVKLELNRSGIVFSPNATLKITTLNLFAGSYDNNGTLTIANGGSIERRLAASTITGNAPDTDPPGFSGGSYDVLYNNAIALTTGLELQPVATGLRDLKKQGAGNTTLGSSVIINRNLTTVAGSGVLQMATFNITLSGTSVFTSDGALSSNTGSASTFTISGSCSLVSSNLTSPAASELQFNNLVVNGDLTPSGTTGNYNVTGNYTVGPFATVNPGTGTGPRIVTFGGTTSIFNNGTAMNLYAVTINNGNTLNAPVTGTSTNTTLGIGSDFTSPGTFNAGASGTIEFSGTNTLSAAEVYRNIHIMGNVISPNIGQTVSGNLINDGSLDLGTGNLTWSGSGTLSGTGTTQLADVNVTGTSCTYTASGNLILADDILGNGSFNASGSTGTVYFDGASSAISGTGTRTFRNVSVTGTLTPGVTYTFMSGGVGAGTLDVTGVLANGGTVVFAGATQTITGTGSTTFNIVTINDGTAVSVSSDITINGNLTLNGNAVAPDGSFTSTGSVTFISLTIQNNGIGLVQLTDVTIGAGNTIPNTNLYITGDLDVTGILSAGTGTAVFKGNTTITGTPSFNNLIIDPVGVLNSSATSIIVRKDFTNHGTFNHNGGTVIFSPAAGVTKNIFGDQDITFFNLQINNTVAAGDDVVNQIDVGKSVNLAGILSFGENGATFDADGAGNSVFTILSTGDNPTQDGMIGRITFTNSTIVGNFVVQRYVNSEMADAQARIYRYISSPVRGAKVSDWQDDFFVTGTFTGADDSSTPGCTGCLTKPSSYYFNQTAAQAYVAYPSPAVPGPAGSSADPLIVGQGYSVFFRHDLAGQNPITIDYTGTYTFAGASPGAAASNIPLTVSNVVNGYSLVGNPYPAPIIWDNGAGWSKLPAGPPNPIADNIVVRDNATGIHKTYSASAGTGVIAAGQSFWVQSSVAGATLTVRETAKSTTQQGTFYHTTDPVLDQLEIQLTKGTTGTTDVALISIQPGSLPTFDSFDSYKFDNNLDNGTTVTQVQDISTDPQKLAVNALPTIGCNQTFVINSKDLINPGETTVNYTLALNPSGATKALTWTLMDNYPSGHFIDMSASPSYSFTVDNSIAASKAINRFSLTVTNTPIDVNLSLTSTAQVCESSSAFITVNGSQLNMMYSLEVNGTTFYPNVAQGTGNDLNIPIESTLLSAGPNTIRVKVTSGCDAQFLAATSTVTLHGLETAVPASAQSCTASSVTLTASGASAPTNYHWYETATSSTVLGTGSQFTTPVLSDTTDYYVAAFNSQGCDGPRAIATAFINDLAGQLNITSSDPIVCRNGIMTFTAESPVTGTFNWYETASSTQVLSATSQFTTPALDRTKKFYVAFTDGNGCEGSRLEVTAEISNFSPVLWGDNGLGDKQICPQGSYTFTANGAPAKASYVWFETIDSPSPVEQSKTFVTPPLAATRNYFLAAINELGCYTDRFAVTAQVDASQPIATFSYSSTQICGNDAALVNVKSLDPGNATYRWYDTSTNGTMLAEGMSYTTDVLSKNTTYYLAAVNGNGCEGSVRKALGVNVTKFDDPVIESTQGLLKSSYPTGNQWYLDNLLLVGETSQILAVTQPGVYNVLVSANGCSAWASPVLKMDFVTGLEDEERTLQFFPNPVSEVLSIRVLGNEVVKCQLIDEHGAAITFIALENDGTGWNGKYDVRSLGRGMYFLRIFSETRSVTHKVIID